MTRALAPLIAASLLVAGALPAQAADYPVKPIRNVVPYAAGGSTDAPEAMPMVKSGRLRALAVTSPRRLPAYPEVPTVAEAGGKDFDMTFWYAFMAPAGTPAEIVAKLNSSIDAILQDKDMRARLAEMSLDVAGGTPARVTELIKRDSARWKKVIDEAGIRVD